MQWILISAGTTAALLAAFFWGKCAYVNVPEVLSRDEAIERGGISMVEMKDNVHALSLALKDQAKWSRYGAISAGVAAILAAGQGILALFVTP